MKTKEKLFPMPPCMERLGPAQVPEVISPRQQLRQVGTDSVSSQSLKCSPGPHTTLPHLTTAKKQTRGAGTPCSV